MKKKFLRGIAVGVLVSVLTTILSALGFLRGWENQVFDFLSWWQKEERSTEVFVIEIDDADYREVFGSTSPLSREKLAALLGKLAQARPRVIGLDVDLETATPQDRFFKETLRSVAAIPVPIVLSLAAGEPVADGKDAGLLFEPPSSRFAEGALFGTTRFPRSKEGVIREMLLFSEFGRGQVHPSFPLAVVAAAAGWDPPSLSAFLNAGPEQEPGAKGRNGRIGALISGARHSPRQKIQFIGDKTSFNALKSSVLLGMPDPYLQAANILRDKILLVGGTFQASRDFHSTPKGELSGIEIIANSVETLLKARPLKPVNHGMELLFEIAMVLLLSLIFSRLSPLKATLVCLVSIVPLAVIGSALAFARLSLWLNFVPAAVSVFLHGEFSLMESVGELRAEVRTLREALEQKDREISRINRMRMDSEAGREQEARNKEA
jgi:adenylate cyclase